MTQPIRKETKVRLEVGMWLVFNIINKVVLQDHREYFILEDPNGLRHFMDAGLYSGYSLNIGKSLYCKVDHINCTGRIFLEPEHPHYMIGKSYYFPIRSLVEKEDKILVILEDCFKNFIEIEVSKEEFQRLQKENSLNCFIRNLKKGVPEIEYSINNS